MSLQPQRMPTFVVDDPRIPTFVVDDLPSNIAARQVQDEKTMNKKIGWLWKKRDYIPGSRKRFFDLKGTKLSYHSSQPETTNAIPRASFDLKGCFAAVVFLTTSLFATFLSCIQECQESIL